MDVEIYKDRAKDLDKEISELFSDISTGVSLDEDALKLRRQQMNDLVKLLDAEQANAKILLAFNEQELAGRKQDLQEQVTFEQHEDAQKANELKQSELELKRKECDIREREADIKAFEASNAEKELNQKATADAAKLDVERKAVLGRIAGEAIKVVGIAISGVLTIVALKGVMKFEKDEDGGILPAKILTKIFNI